MNCKKNDWREMKEMSQQRWFERRCDTRREE